MRILFLSQLFDPENAIKGLSFVKALAAAGHDVDVITAFPSYPGGKVYPGFRQRWRQVEQAAPRVRVTRVATYISQDRSGLKRLLGYASFAAMAFVQALFHKRPDVVYAYYPPVVGGVAAITLGACKRAPVVYDVQDLWPEAVVASGMVREGWLTLVIEGMAGFIYRRAAAVITLSDGYRTALLKKGVASGKVFRIYNWCDEARISVDDDVGSDGRIFSVVYAGNLGAAQGLDAVVRAAGIVAERGHANVRFDFIGDGVEKPVLQELVSSMGLENVRFVDKVPPEQIGPLLGQAGALVAHLRDDPVFSITVPQKTQAYLLAGRPLLMAIGGESADIIRRANAGVVAEPGSPAQIAEAAIHLSGLSAIERQEMGKRGRAFYKQHMSQENGVGQTLALLEQVARPRA